MYDRKSNFSDKLKFLRQCGRLRYPYNAIPKRELNGIYQKEILSTVRKYQWREARISNMTSNASVS